MRDSMYRRWAIIDRQTGVILREGEGPGPDGTLAAQVIPPDGFVLHMDRPPEVSGNSHYWDFEAALWRARPVLPDVSNPFDLTALPAGTLVRITDEVGAVHEITDLSEPVLFEGPQIYRVECRPPAPWVKYVAKLEVP